MADVWYPRAVRKPGAAAGYTRGRNRMRSVKAHYTAGYDSDDLIRTQGLAQFLVTRDGVVIQYAEVDALCYDSGEWNDDGPGIEIEAAPQYGEEVFTDAARLATGALVEWLHSEHGFPLDYWDGARLPEGSWVGFIAHRSLQQSQPHSDFWPRTDWDQMVADGGGPPSPSEEHSCMHIIQNDPASGGDGKWWLFTCNGSTEIPPIDAYNFALAGIPHSSLGSGPVIVALNNAVDRCKA